MAKVIREGKVVLILNGRYAGKKAVVVSTKDEGTKERSYGYATVVGVERAPLKVNKSMGQKRIAKRSKVKPFIKMVNFNHLMPTRYSYDVDFKDLVKEDTVKDPAQKKEARKKIRTLMEESSEMSIFSSQSIQIYAETVGISNLTDELAVTVAQDVEYRLRELIQDATKFMKHSKRTLLKTEDINDALANRNVEKVYGYNSINMSSFRPVSLGNVFYVEDQEGDLDELLKSSFPKVPPRRTFSSKEDFIKITTDHWLAIEGVQPMVPQNPIQKPESLIEIPQPSMQNDVETRPLVKHALPKEQQVYFERMTSMIIHTAEEGIDDIMKSLQGELGLQLLLPYFIQFAAEMVARKLRSIATLARMMKLLGALLDNKNLFVEPYLHQMMPVILTCLVGKRLCNSPSENHWSLRELAALLLGKICTQFQSSYDSIKPRVTKTLLKTFLDVSKPFTSHYGAIIGLSYLGPDVVKAVVLPHLKGYGNVIHPHLSSTSPEKRSEAIKCFNALIKVTSDSLKGEELTNELIDSFGVFGEALVPLFK